MDNNYFFLVFMVIHFEIIFFWSTTQTPVVYMYVHKMNIIKAKHFPRENETRRRFYMKIIIKTYNDSVA